MIYSVIILSANFSSSRWHLPFAMSLNRKLYTIQHILEILKWHRANGGNGHATANRFGLDRKLIRSWLKKEDVFKKHRDASHMRHISLSSKCKYVALDAAVLEYLAEEQTAGHPVSNKQLTAKALQLAPKMNIPPTFKASSMWLKRWKGRNRVSLRCATNDSQKIPDDYLDVLRAFRSDIIGLRSKHGYSSEHIINMDQTMCRFDMAPNKTNSAIGTKSIRITTKKSTKKGFTVALAANGAGEKLPALIILGRKVGPEGKQVSQFPRQCTGYSHHKRLDDFTNVQLVVE